MMIKSTMFAVLAAVLALPACALEGAGDETSNAPSADTATTHEAMINQGSRCPEGYEDWGDGTCVITADPPPNGTTGLGPGGTIGPVGGGTAGGSTPSGSVNEHLQQSACIGKCVDTDEACVVAAKGSPLQVAACTRALTACENICLRLYP